MIYVFYQLEPIESTKKANQDLAYNSINLMSHGDHFSKAKS